MFRLLQLFCVTMIIAPVALAAPTERELMQQNYLSSRFVDSDATAELKLISAQGDTRQRTVKSQSKLAANGVDNTRLARFIFPADVRGLATLTIEQTGSDDKIWVYLPSTRQTRRIQASDKNKPFLGTDFSYGDVMGFRVDDWTYTPMPAEVVAGRSCYKIDARPASPAVAASSGYALRRLWIDKESFVALKVEAFDAGGNVLKRIIASDVRLMDATRKRYQPMMLSAENVETGHRTEIKFTAFQANTGIADDALTVEALELRQ